MSRAGVMAIGMLLWLSGCAHLQAPAARLAKSSEYLCKHCNCFMPADVDEQAICPVCDCGYPAHACRRGR